MAVGLALLAFPRSPAQRWGWSSSLVLAAALVAFPTSSRLVALTRYALLANLAALAGLARYIIRRPIDAWTPARDRAGGAVERAQ